MPGPAEFMDVLPGSLREILRAMPSLAVAFSGGLDSRFLCHAASLCACRVLAIHISGPHVPQRDSQAARSWAARHGIPFISANLNPLDLEDVADNGRERCYFCKKQTFHKIGAIARENEKEPFFLCDGGNRDDEREYRPGLRAVRELGVYSPLSLAGLDKQAIRHFARLSGLENPEQKARPCLLTRFPYGQGPSPELLARLEKTEEKIEEMLKEYGAANVDFRLRMGSPPELHMNQIPRSLLKKIRAILDDNAFFNCEIKQMDRISGYYDSLTSEK